jgi:hypothetical protein
MLTSEAAHSFGLGGLLAVLVPLCHLHERHDSQYVTWYVQLVKKAHKQSPTYPYCDESGAYVAVCWRTKTGVPQLLCCSEQHQAHNSDFNLEQHEPPTTFTLVHVRQWGAPAGSTRRAAVSRVSSTVSMLRGRSCGGTCT